MFRRLRRFDGSNGKMRRLTYVYSAHEPFCVTRKFCRVSVAIKGA
ncbi:hypothetical protein OP10G_3308 [Fimbriimonas ginsengisoli Gsoil 348]|uniref:Uncharacterized protein n=1 Tax=Fimbriimonas ginsengisoli Gsoil 348 TaxID=661478 RepID=A0A068NTB6_FIMGI|nr:hypothetical protein OP10G_3308 [Fimbriimonas ginsengisoli Gsoil 348]